MKHIGWIIILLGALVIVVTGCDANDSETARHYTSDIVYKAGFMDVRKITVDGQEYLLAWSPNGVAITRHDKPLPFRSLHFWDSTDTEPGDIISAETNPFPDTDSLVRYVNKWVRTSPGQSYTNMKCDTNYIRYTSSSRSYRPSRRMHYNPALKIMTY